jgi:hypothetical protein
MTSFPRKRKSKLLFRKIKMDSRLRGNDVIGGFRGPAILIPQSYLTGHGAARQQAW